MKRLNVLFSGLPNTTTTYGAVYEGPIYVVIPSAPALSYKDSDPVYYYNGIAFEVERAGRRDASVPTVVLKIPVENLINDECTKESELMKRLKYYFKWMERDTATYNYRGEDNKQHSLYDGDMLMFLPEPEDPFADEREPELVHDSTYYDKSHAYTLEMSGKMAKDKPTVTVAIPAEEIAPRLLDLWKCAGIDVPCVTQTSDAALDYLRREEESAKLRLNVAGRNNTLVPTVEPLSYAGEPLTVGEFSAIRDAAADFCLRELAPYMDALNAELYNRSRPDKENGKYYLYRPSGEIHTRNASFFALCPQKDYENLGGIRVRLLEDGVERPPKLCLCIRMQIQLPFKKLERAQRMLCKDLPETIDLFAAQLDRKKLAAACELAYRQTKIREYLRDSEYTAFLANGSILPRLSDGVSPMPDAVPFRSTSEDEITVCGVTGMGIRRGVTILTGGGYSGKSTLLDAISSGIYNHTIGDGRELVLTDPSAVSIAAEDGRCVKNTNISPFIKWLPGGDTTDFSTAHASGSTSQAANIMEAVDFGATLLLIDEDRSATNFMIRDNKMKSLIKKEPITPFTDRVQELARRGVSTILVIGGSGEYLGVCDRVYLMEDYLISDVTERAVEIWQTERNPDEIVVPPPEVPWTQNRRLSAEHFSSYPEGMGTERLEVSDTGFLILGDEQVDLRGLYNIASDAQRNGIAFILRQMALQRKTPTIDLDAELDKIYRKLETEGMDSIFSTFFTTVDRFLDLPRQCDVKAVVNRMRKTVWGKEK
ncbi:MAG: P-loop domain-containing protein [Eubacteriales bacterium]